ncbi:MAG: lipid II flippase MurJ [Azoarcus sp.]|nr:lipid II flippase MurJ [Azoarcus sp.]
MSRHWSLILIFTLILLGKLSGFIKDVLITFYHGVSTITDAYFLSSSISSVLYMAIHSAIPVLVVPLYSRLVVNGTSVRVDKDLSAAMFFFFFVSVCVATVVFAAAPWLVDLFAGAIDGRVKELAVSYLYIMALTFALSSLVSFFNAIQTVNKVVVPSYAVPIVNNVVFCLGLFSFSLAIDFDKVLLLGVLAWFVLLLVNYFISRRTFSFKSRAAFLFFADKKFIILFLPAAVSFYVEQLNGFVGVYFATKLGVGAISVFGYSSKLSMIFLSVFLVFLTASLFPRIAVVAARTDQAELFKYLNDCIRLVAICSVPVVIYMSFYSAEIVSVLFQRGKFSGDDVVRVAAVFSVALFALPSCLVRDIMNRVFFSHGNTLMPVLLSLAALAINFALSYLLYQEHGLVGLAVSVVVSSALNGVVMTFLVQRKIGFNLLVPGLKVIALCCIGGLVAYLVLGWLHGVFPEYWLLLFVPFVLVYLVCLSAFRMKEVQVVAALLRRRSA